MGLLFSVTDIFNNAAALLLFASGLAFTVKTGGVQLRSLRTTVSSLVHGTDGDSFRMFSASLAGAAGVGNIVGVSAALSIGGPGAVFWMWAAAFAGMAVKYTETRLSVLLAEKRGKYIVSPIHVTRIALGRTAAILFAVCGIAVSLLMGDTVQMRALADAAAESFGIHRALTGAVGGAVLFVLVSSGFRGVGAFAEKAVPLMTAVYAILCISVLIKNRAAVPTAFSEIFAGAFRPTAAAGGFSGAGVAAAMRCGVSKGIFSNEAGLGSAGFAYGEKNADPEERGRLAAFDVFMDTIVLSTLSALVLLSGGGWRDGASVVFVFGKTLGTYGSAAGSFCVILFAFASAVTWAYYGESCAAYLSGEKGAFFFRLLCAAGAVFGTVADPGSLWAFAEIANAAMMSVNTAAVLRLSFGRR